MKTILRNLLGVLRRFKFAALLNMLGLSVAFTAFMVIMMQWYYDQSFDTSHPQGDCIFRVENAYEGGAGVVICRPLSDAFAQSSPHIKALALCNPWMGEIFFTVNDANGVKSYKEPIVMTYPSITQVFHFDMVEGSDDVLQAPDKILIPESIARKLFGNESALNKLLKTDFQTLTVGGVYKDFPKNTSLNNPIYLQMGDENLHAWENWNYTCYVRLDKPESREGLFANFKKNFTATGEGASLEGRELRLTPIKDLHFVTDTTYDHTPKASKQALLVLFAIAIVIVIIAGINFTNFSTALTPMRIKSINTQKVLGSEEKMIRLSLIAEAVIISLLSFVCSLGLLYSLQYSFLASLVDADLSISVHPVLISITAVLALLTGLLAGLYPSYYMTSFPPALVLKGSFGLSPTGRQLRNVLISIQFIASFSLVIGSLFMYLQNYYMQHTPLGYEKDEIIVTNLSKEIKDSQEAFANQLKSYSGITAVAFAEPLLSSSDQYMGWGRSYRDKEINFQCLPVDYQFLEVMGVEIKEGRNFREEDKNTQEGVYIFNQRAKESYDLAIGERIEGAEIIGFMPDVKFASFRTEVSPMAFFVWGTRNWGTKANFAYIKVSKGVDLGDAMQHVRATLKSMDPEYPFNVRFFNEVLNSLYEKELNLSSLITLFSLIAIFISMVGVFGLVVFDSEYRKKEIGVRKVLGSTTGQIIVMFNKSYVRILIICFVLAAPIAGYSISRWLENFAYKVPMYWWVYAVAFVLISFITVVTVTFQNWRAANENPVNSIKNE
ncbi:ABC transporter permease [Parabacteroides bouchesdurhonensis]|uniref:ABC transporter permease n=1 Tax=Parabacteroides bouchesdurhonensis TaxID=1936995 RepID=UPI000E4CA062|nr:ABC transporter permease [Parabacteroides bouchesdurhonensis]RHJ90692.1 ABC transporter permease [Bacteroides sp. AM07-16]